MLEKMVAKKPIFYLKHRIEQFPLAFSIIFSLGLLSLFKLLDRPNPLGDA